MKISCNTLLLKNNLPLLKMGLQLVLLLFLSEKGYAQTILAHKTATKVPAQKPNIVLIISDDQGYGDFSCFGNKILKTPNLDKLYKESTRLTNFHVSPVCSPSRASIFTGRYNYRTGVWDTWQGRAEMHPDEVTIPEMLAKAGYRTGLFGKWHLGSALPKRPQDQGFKEVFTGGGSRFNPTMTHNGVTRKFTGYMDDIIFDKAIEFIGQKENEPFFACVASLLPHDIGSKQVPDAYVAPYLNIPELEPGDKQVYGMVAKFDENVGRLLNKLKEQDLEKNTVVIFISDNGPLVNSPDLESRPEQLACAEKNMGNRYNAGLRGGKATVYEGGIKTPCFVRWPGEYQAGRDIDALTAHIDLLPTILDITQTPKPADIQIDGISLAPILREETASLPNRTLVIQSHRVEIPQKFVTSAILHEQYKLIDGTQLYNLQTDPSEKNNIANEHPDVVASLREYYERWYTDVKSGRSFIPSYTIAGSTAQPIFSLDASNRFSTGWPLKVESRGPYIITIKEIQTSLFKKGGNIGIRIGNLVIKKPIIAQTQEIVFDNILLPEGDYNLDVFTEGPKEPKKLYYGNEDLGYRNVVVELKK